jgi:hypothetical protein
MSRTIHGESHQTIKYFRETPAALGVLWVYASRTNRDNVAWASGKRLAKDTGWCENECLDARRWLVSHQALEQVYDYIRPQWRTLAPKIRAQKVNFDKTEYYRPTGYIVIKGKRHPVLYEGGERDETGELISDITDASPHKVSVNKDIEGNLPMHHGDRYRSGVDIDLHGDELDSYKEQLDSLLESTTVDSKATPSIEGQPVASSEIIEQWGYRVGQIAYWWYKEGQKWVPGKIIRFTPNYAYFETKDKQGNIHIKWRGINGCSPDGSTDDWFQLVDLKPLQQVIARYSFKVTSEQRISADLNTRINMVYSELTGRWQNGSSVTPVELEAAYNWQAQEGGITPTMPVAVGTMLGKYRDVKLPSGKQSQRKFIHVPGCEMCTDGMVIDQNGKSQQCPNCLALAESGDLKEAA